jgi:hypothetical protein
MEGGGEGMVRARERKGVRVGRSALDGLMIA